MDGLIPYFLEKFRDALKIRVKIHRSSPICWHFCWYLGRATFATNFAISNEQMEQMTRKNHGARCQAEHFDCRAPVMG
jgi:predicted outer membrane lipoprotein